MKLFDKEKYPHININNAVGMPSGKLWPLCDLKFLGNCQNIAIIPLEKHQAGQSYYWETAPKIKSCNLCKFHKRTCERC